MINVQGQVYVTNLKEVSPRLITGTVYSFEKVGEDFKTTFVKAKFVGDAIEFLITKNIKEKDKVYIESGVLKSNDWTNKDGKKNSQIEITCFKLSEIQAKEEKKEEKSSRFKRWNSDEFEGTPYDCGDLPF